MARKSARSLAAVEDDTTPAEVEETEEAGVFMAVDDSEVISATARPRASKYDELVSTAFENPGQWYKVNRVFSANGSIAVIRKRYADLVDDDGNVLHVKTARTDGGYLAYVKVDAPKDAPAEDDGE